MDMVYGLGRLTVLDAFIRNIYILYYFYVRHPGYPYINPLSCHPSVLAPYNRVCLKHNDTADMLYVMEL